MKSSCFYIILSEEHLFSLDQLHRRLESFDYGYNMAKNKPSPISDSRLQSLQSNILRQSGKLLHVMETYYYVLDMCSRIS